MKLLTYMTKAGYGLGAVINEYALDLNKALGTKLDMQGLLELGEKGMVKTREAVKQAEDKAASGNTSGLHKLNELKLAAPLPWTRKNIVCLGLNYAEHVKEGGSDRDLPPHPIFFTKPPTTITGPYDPVVYNKAVERLDYEVELAFVIGKEGKYISKDEVYDHVAGYMVFQDISARKLQRQHLQWYRGKSQDTFAPMGPYLVTPYEVGDPQKLDISCKVNGETRQKANTEDMIFDIKTIVNTLSDGMTLEVGDIFATGTPSGVGAAHPSGLLKVGDIIESSIQKLGTMKNPVVSEK
ncbi:MAG: fumarylacetoacetate hydrolase family protein [Candidatus Bathyarchaeota archaeon]|nr:fumarylacetoacetate hydrolase family protein [Candidatus Bathyarchaeota archaeon]